MWRVLEKSLLHRRANRASSCRGASVSAPAGEPLMAPTTFGNHAASRPSLRDDHPPYMIAGLQRVISSKHGITKMMLRARVISSEGNHRLPPHSTNERKDMKTVTCSCNSHLVSVRRSRWCSPPVVTKSARARCPPSNRTCVQNSIMSSNDAFCRFEVEKLKCR